MINNSITPENISNYIKEGEKLYILDLDAIEKNKTNFELYQKISTMYDLWIDCGPRNIGDVVDIFMVGATSITIRTNRYSKFNLADIRDISENKVYLNIELNNLKNYKVEDIFLKDFDGFVNFSNMEEIEKNNELEQYKNKTYFYENNAKNMSFWQALGANGLLVDISKLKEFRNGI
jgi:uncharacterized protein related to proFAR isomerase